MYKNANNPIFQYLLILCLSLAFLLVQANRLHIHIDQPGSAESAAFEPAVFKHVNNVHVASLQHDSDLTHHHHVAIDVSFDIKKANLLDPLIPLLLVVGFFLIVPRLVCMRRQRSYAAPYSFYYYLLHPPLRAPPVK